MLGHFVPIELRDKGFFLLGGIQQTFFVIFLQPFKEIFLIVERLAGVGGVVTAAASERLLTAIGFKKADGEYFCDMNGMFDGNCDGHTINL